MDSTQFGAGRALHKAIDGIEAALAVDAAFDLLIATGAIRDVPTSDIAVIRQRIEEARDAFERTWNNVDDFYAARLGRTP